MGEVYRATDTKLDREVAIKVLPESFAQDKERLARFEREAKMLASLNHPNIASIYGLEDSDGKKALVLELIEGETLTERLRTGAIPIEESLDICKQIAEALEAAHEKGIIHRDLKPGNIKITPDGKVKVLDFGLAKAAIADSSVAPSDNSQSPTLTADYTRPGVILGTAAYMSPEQARAKQVDKRTDIWSFGCVLYECLTGKCLFRGEDVTETLATVIKGEPQWTDLPTDTPLIIQLLIRKCLVKDRKHRLRDIGDALVDMEKSIADPNWGVASGNPSSGAKQGTNTGVLAAAVVVTGLITLALGWFLKPLPSPSPPPPKINVTVTLDKDLQLFTNWGSSLELSKDGLHLAFTTGSPIPDDQDTSRLHLFSFTTGEYKVIQGSEGAYLPFFSPDGMSLGFFTFDALKTVSLSGGSPRKLVSISNTLSRGADWSSDGFIVCRLPGGGLMKLPDSGGATELTIPGRRRGLAWPQFLPDDRHVLLTVSPRRGNDDPHNIKLLDVQNPGSLKTIIPKGSFARYVESGHIIYHDDGWLYAVPFDTNKLEIVEPSKALMPVAATWAHNPQFAVAQSAGTLAYLPGTGKGISDYKKSLVWVSEGDKTNKVVIPDAGDVSSFSFSPNDTKVAVLEDGDIWIIDLLRPRSPRRITVDEGVNGAPVWSGEWIIFSSSRSGKKGLWRTKDDGTGKPELILEHEEHGLLPTSVSDDGKILVYIRFIEMGNADAWIKNMDDTTDQGKPLLDSPFPEQRPRISPDGLSIAYEMDQGRGDQIYLRKINGEGFELMVSSGGGSRPRWSGDGKKLFYYNNQAIWSVDIAMNEEGYQIGTPKEVVQSPEGVDRRRWNVTSDGKRFLFLVDEARLGSPTTDGSATVNIIFNWFTELNKLLPIE